MNEMMKRVKQAIVDSDPTDEWAAARAAIAAMREPTDKVLDSLYDSLSDNITATKMWQAAIDAALKDEDVEG